MLTFEATTALQEFMSKQLLENRELITQAAILSIAAWEKKLVTIHHRFGNCPLCRSSIDIGKSLLRKRCLDNKEMCINCPLTAIGNSCNSQNSAYKAAMNAMNAGMDMASRYDRMKEMPQLLKDINEVIVGEMIK